MVSGGGGLTGCLKCHETASCGFFEVVGKILIIHHISVTIVIKIVMATLKKHTHFHGRKNHGGRGDSSPPNLKGKGAEPP